MHIYSVIPVRNSPNSPPVDEMKVASHLLLRACSVLILARVVCSTQHYNSKACNASLPRYHLDEPDYKIPIGSVDRNGNVTLSAADIVGYTYETCLEVCGIGVGPNELVSIIQELTLWFLPYLVLLAQVPFMTENKLGDFAVCFYTFGSPLLALYSLFLSLLNWKWIKDICRRRLARDGDDAEMVKSLPNVLGQLQQYPIAIPNTEMLASALGLTENQTWWVSLRDHLVDRERRLDASGTAQLFLAIVVYIFAVTEAFAQIGGMTLPSRG